MVLSRAALKATVFVILLLADLLLLLEVVATAAVVSLGASVVACAAAVKRFFEVATRWVLRVVVRHAEPAASC